MGHFRRALQLETIRGQLRERVAIPGLMRAPLCFLTREITVSLTDKEPEKKTTQKHPGVVIHAEHCKGCGRCVVACPKGVLTISGVINSHGYAIAEATEPDKCVRCGMCFYNCPEPNGISIIRNTD